MGDFNIQEIIEVLNGIGSITNAITDSTNKQAELVQKQNLMEKADTLKAIADGNKREAALELDQIKELYNASHLDNTSVRNDVDKLGITTADLERITGQHRTPGATAINDSLGIQLNEDLTYSNQITEDYRENLERKKIATEKTNEMNTFIRGIANNVTDLHQFVTEDPNAPIKVGTEEGISGVIDKADLEAFTETPYGQSIFKDKPWLKRIFLSSDENQFLPTYTDLELQSKGYQKEQGTGRIVKTDSITDGTLSKEEHLINEDLTNDGYGWLALTKIEKENGVTMQDKLEKQISYEDVKRLENAKIQENNDLLEVATQNQQIKENQMKYKEELINYALSSAERVDDLLDHGHYNLDAIYKIKDLGFGSGTLSKDVGYDEVKADRIIEEGADKLLFNIDRILSAYFTAQGDGEGWWDAMDYTNFMSEMRLKNPTFGTNKYDRGNSAGLENFLGAPGKGGYDDIVYYTLDGKATVNRDKLKTALKAEHFLSGRAYHMGADEQATLDGLIGNILLYKTLQEGMIADPLKYKMTLNDEQKVEFIAFELSLKMNPVNPATGQTWTKEEIEEVKQKILNNKNSQNTSQNKEAIMQSLNMLA